jgi:hypothetical protein
VNGIPRLLRARGVHKLHVRLQEQHSTKERQQKEVRQRVTLQRS